MTQRKVATPWRSGMLSRSECTVPEHAHCDAPFIYERLTVIQS